MAVVAVGGVIGLGAALAWPLQPGPDHEGRTATIALIQGNVPDVGLDFEDRPRQVLDDHVNETMKLAAEITAGTVAKPSLIVWPENSSDIDPFSDQAAYDEIIATAVHQHGVCVGVGSDRVVELIRRLGP